MEDKKITEMFFLRNESAINELLKKYGRLYKSIALNILGNEQDAEECVNDALVEIWNAIPPANPELLMPFTCKFVRCISINRLKFNLAEKRCSDNTLYLSELSDCFSETHDDIAKMLDSNQFHNILNGYLKQLDNESRALFVRRYFFFEGVNELSERFGISENKVSVKLHRLRKKLALKLKEEGIYE